MPEQKKAVLVFKYLFFGVYSAAVICGAVFYHGHIFAANASRPGLDLKAVLPAFSNQPEEESFEIDGRRIYPARAEKQVRLDEASDPVTMNVLTGFAFWIEENRDGEGSNPVLIGLDTQGKVTGVRMKFIRKAAVPENRLQPDLVPAAQEFFDSRRAYFFEKASEGAMS